jgi:hypothetical protein
MVVRIAGKRVYLWRAVDHEGEILDVLVAAPARCPGGAPVNAQASQEARLRAETAGAQLVCHPTARRSGICD